MRIRRLFYHFLTSDQTPLNHNPCRQMIITISSSSSSSSSSVRNTKWPTNDEGLNSIPSESSGMTHLWPCSFSDKGWGWRRNKIRKIFSLIAQWWLGGFLTTTIWHPSGHKLRAEEGWFGGGRVPPIQTRHPSELNRQKPRATRKRNNHCRPAWVVSLVKPHEEAKEVEETNQKAGFVGKNQRMKSQIRA